MNKTFHQQEKAWIYFGLAFLLLGVFLFGIWLVDYYTWVVIAPFIIVLGKGFRSRNPVPAVLLTEESISFLITDKLYRFEDIKNFNANSKWFNGSLRLKNKNKKIPVPTVALSLDDQKEITDYIKTKLLD